MKQTALDWFIYQITKNNMLAIDAISLAKEMEKQQIIDAFWNGDNSDCISEQNSKEFAEQYYNETFNK